MRMTKEQRALVAFASKSDMRPALACVKFDGETAVATDSFRLVEIKQKEAPKPTETVMLNAYQLGKVKLGREINFEIEPKGHIATAKTGDVAVNIKTTENPDEYPKYEQIFQAAEDRPHVEIYLNGEYLATIVKTCAAINEGDEVVLCVPTDKKVHYPVLVKAEGKGQKSRALVMPLNK